MVRLPFPDSKKFGAVKERTGLQTPLSLRAVGSTMLDRVKGTANLQTRKSEQNETRVPRTTWFIQATRRYSIRHGSCVLVEKTSKKTLGKYFGSSGVQRHFQALSDVPN